MKHLAILALASLASVASPTNRPNILTIQEETRWHGWVPSGQVVEVNNIHGNIRAEPATGPLSVMRYNMYASAAVNGVPAPGVAQF